MDSTEFELPPIQSSDSIELPTKEQYASREEDYRRGFTHGMAYAIELIDSLRRKGFVRSAEISNILEEFNLRVLYPWRWKAFEDAQEGYGPKLDGHPHLHQENWNDIRFRILERDGHSCRHCGARATPLSNLQVDHIFPVALGGLPSDSNLQTLCRVCNMEKGCAE